MQGVSLKFRRPQPARLSRVGVDELTGDVGAAAVAVDDRCTNLCTAHFADQRFGLLVSQEVSRAVFGPAATRTV